LRKPNNSRKATKVTLYIRRRLFFIKENFFMNATVTDCKEAGEVLKTFLENPNETHLFIKIESEFAGNNYTIVKLPYGENIYLLYGSSWHNTVLHPGIDLKYAGFYSRQHKQGYNIREPLTCFFRFDNKMTYESKIKDMVKKAVQRTVADRAADKTAEFKGLSVDNLKAEILSDAETAFSKEETMLDFSSKIVFDEYYISEAAMVDYIDNPKNINNPNSQLKRYVDEKINGHEAELVRLYFACQASQKILDRLYSEYVEGEKNNQS